jgi:hypothetical protein
MPKVKGKPKNGNGNKTTVKEEVVEQVEEVETEEVETGDGDSTRQKEVSLPKDETPSKVLYPKFEIQKCFTGSEGEGEADPIDCFTAKQMLGWETETQWKARVCKMHPELKPEDLAFGVTKDDTGRKVYELLTDEYGEKVHCTNNNKNRDFKSHHARKLAQEILTRRWAGPLCFPDETVNGETIQIGRTGRVQSGQHRLIGFVLACQIWAKKKDKWKSNWPEEPLLETLVVTGVSEAPQITSTLDNTLARTLYDILKTSDEFSNVVDRNERTELTKMLSKAIRFCWDRVGASYVDGDRVYESHSESKNWHELHPSIDKCVRYIFGENKERVLTKLLGSAGVCAGAMYLMAASDNSGEKYREEPRESRLKLNMRDKAEQFWAFLVKKSAQSQLIRDAIAKCADEGAGGTAVEKLCIIAKAWNNYKQGKKITPETVKLVYVQDEKVPEVKKLDSESLPDFGGIDLGPKQELKEEQGPQEGDPSPADIENGKSESRKAAEAEIAAKLQKGKTPTPATNNKKKGIMDFVPSDKAAATAKK